MKPKFLPGDCVVPSSSCAIIDKDSPAIVVSVRKANYMLSVNDYGQYVYYVLSGNGKMFGPMFGSELHGVV